MQLAHMGLESCAPSIALLQHWGCRNVTDDPGMRIKLRPVTKPNERWPLCLQLVEGTRVCVIRADIAQSMTQDIFPTLRALRGSALARDIMVWNMGCAKRLCGLCCRAGVQNAGPPRRAALLTASWACVGALPDRAGQGAPADKPGQKAGFEVDVLQSSQLGAV